MDHAPVAHTMLRVCALTDNAHLIRHTLRCSARALIPKTRSHSSLRSRHSHGPSTDTDLHAWIAEPARSHRCVAFSTVLCLLRIPVSPLFLFVGCGVR
jgi:hypothetical protein